LNYIFNNYNLNNYKLL